MYEVWTQPQHVAKWWGPTGFTITTDSMEAKPGGVWQFMMHGPDGIDYPNKIFYTEVSKPERLAYRHTGGDPALEFQVTVVFEDLGDKTGITMRAVFASPEARDFVVREHNAIEGGRQTLARLSEYVVQL